MKNSTSRYRVPNEYAKDYLSRNEGLTIVPSTASAYDSQLTLFVTFLNHRTTSVLDADFTDVLEFIESCVRQGNRKSTISSKLSTIGELYKFIRLRTDVGDELSLEPLRLEEIDLDQYNTPEPIEREALSKEEIRRLFDAFDSYRNRLIAVVGVETGMRNSDLRTLRIKDINEDTLHVFDPKNSKPYDVPISEELSFELDFWMQNHRGGFAAASDSEFVFPSQQGAKLEHNESLNTIIKGAAEDAGIQDVIGKSRLTPAQNEFYDTEKDYREYHRVTVHTLRHSFITLLQDAGVSLPYRQLVANHSSPETTQGYSHGDDQAFDSVRDQFNPPR